MKIGWVYLSESENKKSLDILSRLLTPGAVDELGLGIVRDAFANEFFPGTSTIQTRAKYFIILNNILDDFSSENIKSKKIEQLVYDFRVEEYKCAERLNKLYKNKPGEEVNGIIGGDNEYMGSESKWIRRTPSQIYWNGLKTYGIVNDVTSIRNYLYKSLQEKEKPKESASGKAYDKKKSAHKYNYDNSVDIIQKFNFGCNSEDTYKKTSNWINELTINLTKDEALFLKNRIIESPHSAGKLYSWLLNKKVNINSILAKLDKTQHAQGFEHTFEFFSNYLISTYKDLPEDYKYLLELANKYNRLCTLARIRYNYILSDKANKDWKKIWDDYKIETNKLPDDLIDKIYDRFSSLKHRNFDFLKNILKEYNQNFSKSDSAFNHFDEYLIQQERNIKGDKRARLFNKDKKFVEGKQVWIGGTEIDFRLGITADMIDDIMEGLNA